MTEFVNKVRDAVDAVTHKKSDKAHQTNNYESNNSTNHGPHDSNFANTADPRVDSDQSALNSRGHAAEPLNTGANHNIHESSRSSNYGPHDSNVGNIVDPRVDSTREAHSSGFTNQNTASHTGSSGLNTGSHTGSTGYGSGAPPLGTGHNTYDSINVGNTMDPGVNSDRTGRNGSTGLNTGASGLNSGAHTGSRNTAASYGSAAPLTGNRANAQESASSSNHGPHASNMANAMDPRVDSKRHNFNDDVHKSSLAGEPEMMHLSGNSGPNTSTRTFEEAHQTGAASTGASSSYNKGRGSHSTAGPHSSDIGNKLDPRVDSDRDGSKTIGTPHQRI